MRRRIDIPKTYKIIRVRQENPTMVTLVFDCDFQARPGQFVNMWIPRLDEKPLSVAYSDGKELHITIADVGPFSHAATQLKAGDQAGLRGPYGTMFMWKPKQKIAMVGGGFGSAPLFYAATEAIKDDCEIDFIIGARAKDLLIYTEDIKKLKNTTLHLATDDGSEGHKGYNVEILEKLMKEKKFDLVMTCGPELMMVAARKLADANDTDIQVSLERYMRCGFGLCGQCAVDDIGDRICTKGPIVSSEYLKSVTEFGVYHRDRLGKKHKF